MSNLRIDQLDPHAPLDGNDLLHLYQTDGVDRKSSLADHFVWVKAQPGFAPSLDAGVFYVDSAAGSDAADGRSQATAMQTIKAACDAIPLGATAEILLVNSITPYAIGADYIFLDGKTINVSGQSDTERAAIEQAGFDFEGTQTRARGFVVQSGILSFQYCTFRTASLISAQPPGNIQGILSDVATTALSHVRLRQCEIILDDLDFMRLSGQNQSIELGLHMVDITLAPSSGTPGWLVELAHQPLVFQANALVLPMATTIKSLFSELSYGADKAPVNVLHNLGNALDSDQP